MPTNKVKKVTLATVHVPHVAAHLITDQSQDLEVIKRNWGDETQAKLDHIKKSILVEFEDSLDYRIEQPRPLKQKGKVIGYEPFKIIISACPSWLADRNWCTQFGLNLAVSAQVASWHPTLKPIVTMPKKAA